MTLQDLKDILDQLNHTRAKHDLIQSVPGAYGWCLSCRAALVPNAEVHDEDCPCVRVRDVITKEIARGEEAVARNGDYLMVWRAHHDPPLFAAHEAGAEQRQQHIARWLKNKDFVEDYFGDAPPTPYNIGCALEERKIPQ